MRWITYRPTLAHRAPPWGSSPRPAHRDGLGPEYGIEFLGGETAERAPVRVALPGVPAPSLYPVHVQASMRLEPQRAPAAASPPPLGDWPRRRLEKSPSLDSASPSPSAATPRARHPRTGSAGSLNGRQRPIPPPLDLTRISAYRQIEERARQ